MSSWTKESRSSSCKSWSLHKSRRFLYYRKIYTRKNKNKKIPLSYSREFMNMRNSLLNMRSSWMHKRVLHKIKSLHCSSNSPIKRNTYMSKMRRSRRCRLNLSLHNYKILHKIKSLHYSSNSPIKRNTYTSKMRRSRRCRPKHKPNPSLIQLLEIHWMKWSKWLECFTSLWSKDSILIRMQIEYINTD
jgi:hypothetical protein